ncbi:hypothetical protein J4G53_24090 [Serratia ureilytica]|uniref:hypothetical protein n=1 Tax=Serratia ureilytica TaxID=300181 RepID=UPI001AA18A8C|nr:hypothetical protein [Serratia ureilytica]MBO1811321.1 hypothetical protein [Serratia ureilytica]
MKIFTARARRVLKLLVLLMAMTCIALLLAHWGVNHPSESAALRDWMQRTRYGWLGWRLVLYAGLAWGVWRIWRVPGFRPEYRPALRRMAIAGAVFALLCEYSVFGGGLSL